MPAVATLPSDRTGSDNRLPGRLSGRVRRAVELTTAVLAMSTSLVAGAAPASAKDDYPWRGASGVAADSWGFTLRQCVSWTAFKLAQRGAPLDNRRDRWGNAANWDDAARRLGHGIGTRPVVGAVAHWNAGERGAAYTGRSPKANGFVIGGGTGHVGYVTGVHADGSAVVQHYNQDGKGTWSIVRVRAPRYLYVRVTAPA